MTKSSFIHILPKNHFHVTATKVCLRLDLPFFLHVMRPLLRARPIVSQQTVTRINNAPKKYSLIAHSIETVILCAV